MPSLARRLAVSLSLLTALALPPAGAWAATAPPAWKPFAPDSVFNLPLRDDAPLSGDSASQVAWLRSSNAVNGTWINSTSCGMPIYWADAGTPRVAVALDHPSYADPALIRAWSSVPIPAEARAANCADRNFAVLQTQPDGTVTEWEFWAAERRADSGWVAKWGGVTLDVMADRGVASPWQWLDAASQALAPLRSNVHWNVTATSMSMLAGTITLDDVNRGAIDHVVAMALHDVAGGRWAWPAQRTDGGSVSDPDAIEEGARLRIDPSADLDALTMTPLVRMIAEAAQRYGIVVRDKTHGVNVFTAEEPHAGQPNPFAALLAGRPPNVALGAFPWDRLQVLESPRCTSASSCTVVPEPVIDVDTPAPRVNERIAFDTSNSTLEHPRRLVEWDFDGDGRYELDAGAAVKASFVPGSPGTLQVGVRITTRDNVVSTGQTTLLIAGPRQPVRRPPSAVRPKFFYSYGGQTPLQSISATTEPPSVPDRYRKLYAGGASGSFEIDFGGAAAGTLGDVVARAWIECSASRCLRLGLVDGAGSELSATDAPPGSSGWVSFRLRGPVSSSRLAGLRLRGAVRNAPSAAGTTSVSAVSMLVESD